MSSLFSEKYSLNKIRHDNRKFNSTLREVENLSFSLSCPSLREMISHVVCIRVFIVNVSRMWTMSCWQPSLPPLPSQLLFLAGSRTWSAARQLATAAHPLPRILSHSLSSVSSASNSGHSNVMAMTLLSARRQVCTLQHCTAASISLFSLGQSPCSAQCRPSFVGAEMWSQAITWQSLVNGGAAGIITCRGILNFNHIK